MSAGTVILIVSGGSTALFLGIWILIRLYQIIRPEGPLPSYVDPHDERRRLTDKGYAVAVGYREIYEDLRRIDSAAILKSGTDGLYRQN